MEVQVLKGKVALVTGGNSGIGFGAAKSLIEAGAFVYITARRQEQLDEAVARLGQIYAATKAAVRSFARSWTTDLKHRKIRVNALSPGVVPTEGYRTEQGMSEEQVQNYVDRVTTEIPVGRVGTAQDMGNAVVFLASEASSFITGIELTVDGGQTMVYAGKN